MATFQKGNWTRTAVGEHARVYAPGAIASANITGNGGTQTVTLTVPWQFQGNGQVAATLPVTANAINSALDISTAVLLAPASGSYSAGNHPRVQIQIQNSTNGNLTPLANDLVVVQY